MDELDYTKHCIPPRADCPKCNGAGIWYSNYSENYWGHFRDGWCEDCKAKWTEITNSRKVSAEWVKLMHREDS
jgi:Zn finger protein HypA/HybF involved in hydrogenase expression